jgi:DNA-binding MarR family transcriptional regulator
MTMKQSLSEVLREWVEVFMQRSFRDFRRFMDDNDLSPSQLGSLMQLYRCGTCGVSDISDHLGVTVPAASQLVERLVQQGLLERSEDPHDRRFKQVTLTSRGKAMVEGGFEARQNWMEQLTTAFSPEEQKTIIGALKLLTNAARELEVNQA